MVQNEIQLGKDSVRISYLRFLSDSAAGLLVVLLAGLWVLTNPQVRGYLAVQPPGPSLSIFVLVVLFIFATPLGLAMNALSWFALGGLTEWTDERFAIMAIQWARSSANGEAAPIAKAGTSGLSREQTGPRAAESVAGSRRGAYAYVLGPTLDGAKWHEIVRAWRLGSDPASTASGWWRSTCGLLSEALELYYPRVHNALEYLRGLHIMLRNFGLLALLCWPLLPSILGNIGIKLGPAVLGGPIYVSDVLIITLTLVIGLTCIVLSSLVHFYCHVRVICITYLLYARKDGYTKLKSGLDEPRRSDGRERVANAIDWIVQNALISTLFAPSASETPHDAQDGVAGRGKSGRPESAGEIQEDTPIPTPPSERAATDVAAAPDPGPGNAAAAERPTPCGTSTAPSGIPTCEAGAE